ncbi:MAG: helix-hairpin-helix domain-containing protein [Pseudomonadota bacterium]
MRGLNHTIAAAILAFGLTNPLLAVEPVDINAADAATIAAAIDGVGLKRAAAIVAYREANGPFTSVQDLTMVRGVGEKTVNAAAKNLVAR